MSKSALSTFRAKEEEIERKKMEVREKVQAHLGRVEEETKRLASIREVKILPFLYYLITLQLHLCAATFNFSFIDGVLQVTTLK